MAGVSNIVSIGHCFSCLSSTEEKPLQIYYIQQATLKSILQTEQIILCYICKKLARNAEQFLQNVEIAHYLLLGLKDLFKENVEYVMRPIVNLAVSPIELIDFGAEEQTLNEGCETSLEQLPDIPEVAADFEYTKIKENTLLCNDDANEKLAEDNIVLELPNQETISEVPRVEYQNNVTTSETIEDTVQDKENDLQKKLDSLIKIFEISKDVCLNELAAERLKTKYIKAEFKCDDCVKSFAIKFWYDNHMENHREAKGNCVCDICKMRFECDDALQLHLQCHMRRYQCNECYLVKAVRNDIERHILSWHIGGLHVQCARCYKKFKDEQGLMAHLRKAHLEEPKCSWCDRRFASKDTLRTHVRTFHEASERGRQFPCEECGKILKSPASLKHHMKTHSDKRDFYCVECNMYFKTQLNLDNHLKQSMKHVAVENHPCPICKKILRTKHLMKYHVKTAHRPVPRRRFCCDQCGKTYKSKANLVLHIQEHMGLKRARNYVCVVCNKAYYTQRYLDMHLNIHTGATPYHCQRCPAKFNHSASLFNHTKLVHEKADNRKRKGKHRRATHTK